VLHTTGPNERPPTAECVTRLSALAAQAGSTIGTVRSTETTMRQATTDGLTGLINPRTLENEMRVLIERREPFATATADLDHFKQINDTSGHEAGDRALRLFSEVVQSHIRSDDIVGRYGGEEFVFLFPKQTAERAYDTPRFTASYGLCDSQHGASMDEILRVADEALARAKHAGRDRIVRSDFRVDQTANASTT
jgi:PleD family two-component response regulator